MIPLTNLNPKWNGLLRPDSGEGLSFDCPVCGPKHRLQVFFSNPLDGQSTASWQRQTWKRIGESFDALTIEPSIQYLCFHGWIEDGQVINISESTLSALMVVGGVQRLVALSPKQAAALRSK